jgi:hypothetical protein
MIEPFVLEREMKQLTTHYGNLRRGDPEEHPSTVIGRVTNVFRSLTSGLFSIQEKLVAGDTEGAGRGLKELVGDVHSVVQATKDMKQIEGFDNLPSIFDKHEVSNTDYSLVDVSDSIIGESIHPEWIEQYVDFTNELKETLEGIDHTSLDHVWSMNQKKRRLNYGKHNVNQASTDEFSEFHFDGINFDQYGPIKSFASNLFDKRSHGGRASMPRIHSFIADHEVDTVMAKHQRKLTASDDVCLPQCDVSEEECNCNRLFDCVKELDEYDLAGELYFDSIKPVPRISTHV